MAPFCSCPVSLVSRKFFAVGPVCAKCVFLLRSVGRRDLSAGPEQKKKHHLGCFFFAPAPGKGRGRRSPVPTRGQSKKKKHHPGCFFLLRPRRKAREGEAPLGAGTGPEQKKKTPPRVGPRGKAGEGEAPCRVFFLFFAGARAKKKHPGWCFVFCCGPVRTLTHSLRAWVAMPPPRRGGVFFCCGPARTGVVFFFLLWPCPDAHSLTVGWGDFGKARVVFFFLLRPRRVFLDNSKKVWGTTSGLKRPGGATAKKKNTTSL